MNEVPKLIVPIFDLKKQRWLPDSCGVTLRKTLLGTLYPDVQWAIGDAGGLIAGDDWDEAEVAAVLDKGWEDYRIVGASGSRKKGRVLFAKGSGDYFTRYFGNAAKAINYGSNFSTECRSLVSMSLNILIVDDGVAMTGDCHATASAQFFAALGMEAYTPFQFRVCDPDNLWVAKGTMAYNQQLDQTEYAIAIPRSAFKGNSPGDSGGRFVQNFLLGVVHMAEVRQVNMSYSVTQFLPWSAVEEDILPPTIDAAVRLGQVTSNPTLLAKHLLRWLCGEEELEEEEGTYVPYLQQIVSSDVHGQLASHPWVIERVYQLFQSRWLKLALSGDVKFNSSMVMPDEGLADGEVCIPGVPDGMKVIVFPYPCRWQHDLAIWTNRALPKWQKYSGVIMANAATQLTLGRDSDGDMLQWLPAPCLPHCAAAISQMPPAPELTKPVKQKAQGSLGEIAVRAMNNGVGLITYHIAKAQALACTDIIPQLAQQLQIEVDSLKNVQRADWNLIEELCGETRKRSVGWLSDRKSKEVFTTRVINSEGGDTVSKLAAEVSKYWVKPEIRVAPLKDFNYLFPRPDTRWFEKAGLRHEQYNADMRWANAPMQPYWGKKEHPGRSIKEQCKERRKGIVEKWSHLLDECPDSFHAAAAIWHHCHNPKSKSANFVFVVCLPEILGQLEQLQVKEFGVFHIKSRFTEPILTEVVWNGPYKKLVTRCGQEVGDVPAFAPLTQMVVQLEESSSNRLVAVVVGEDSLSF